METLQKQAALAPRLPYSGAAAARSGSLSSSATSSSCSRKTCRPTLLPLPTITLFPRGNAFASALERRQTFCRCCRWAGDGLSGVYNYAQQMVSCTGGREIFKAEPHGKFSSSGHSPLSVEVRAFRQRFELVCRVIHFTKSGRPRPPVVVMSSLNGNNETGEGNVDLELEVFRFMEQSSKPDAFPTRQDLISAGRSDLVRAIEEEGGWLAAGWEEAETNVSTEEKSARRRPRQKSKARSVKHSSSTRQSSRVATVKIDERNHEIAEELNGTHMVREVVNAMDDKDGRKKGNQMTMLSVDNDDLQILERLTSVFSLTEGLKLKRPQEGYQWDSLSQDSARHDFANGVIEATISSKCFSENGFETGAMVDAPAVSSLLDSRDAIIDVRDLPKKKRNPRKKRRAKVMKEKGPDEVNGKSDWIHQIFDKSEKWRLETRSRSGENLFAASLTVDSKSTENRIHTLAAKLVDTRAALQSVSGELWKSGNADDEEHRGTLSEFIDAEDTLEFRENAIMRARTELNTTRAQVTALEGNLNVEIMEARKILEEKNREVEWARSVSQHLRTGRIVWPNPANEVFLTGSFDSWNSQVKMEKSSAGVFTCSLPLYPGKYEIKFVVDGSWRVDTNRPIVYVGGFENNVLTVS